MPFFSSVIVQLDFDAHRLALSPAGSAPKATWGRAIPVSYNEGGLPTIYVTFSDAGGDIFGEECIVDTGFNGSLSLPSNLYAQLFDKGLIVPRGEFRFASVSGDQWSRQGMLRNVKINDWEVRDILVEDGGKKSKSVIGITFLRRFRVTFDIPNDRIYLAKGAGFENPDKISLVGIGLLRRGRRTIVADVRPHSPAEEAKIFVNDELIEVAGEPIADKPLGEVHWILREYVDPNTQLDLVCSHQGEVRKVTIHIHDWLP
jgi:predicted aspartyl protease